MKPHASRSLNTAVSAAIWLAAYMIYLLAAAPGITMDDSGELAACAALLGNSHAPGYPVQFLLGRLAMLVPAGSPAFRMTLLSTASGAFAVLGIRALAAEAAVICGLAPAITSLAAVIFAALAPSLWRQSAVCEKYALFAALLSWTLVHLLRARLDPRPSRVATIGLLAGLTAAQHYLAACLLVPLVAVMPAIRTRRTIATAMIFLALPISTRVLYPPVRSAGNAILNVGRPDSGRRLTAYLGVRSYSDRFATPSRAGGLTVRLKRQGGMFVEEFGPVLVVAVAGACLLLLRSPPAGVAALALVLTDVILVQSRIDLPVAYNLPAYLLVAVFAALGCGWLDSFRRAGRLIAVILAAWMAVQGSTVFTRSRNFLAPDFSRSVDAGLPAGAVLVAHDDAWLFPLWYRFGVLGYRPDVTVVTSLFDAPAGIGPGGWKIPLEKIASGYGGGVAILWRLARGYPEGVFADPVEVPLPSRGWFWHGLCARITGVRDATGIDPDDLRVFNTVAWRNILNPIDQRNRDFLARLAATVLYRARLSARAGNAPLASRYTALAGRIVPGIAVSPDAPDSGGPAPRDTVARRARARDRIRRGWTVLQEMHPAEAAAYFDEAARLDPGSAEPWNARARLAYLEERFPDAKTAYGRALKLDPGNPVLVEGMEKTRLAADSAARLANLEAKAAAFPGDPAARCELGNAYFRMGRDRAAEEQYRTALGIDPGHSRAWNNLGSVFSARGNFRAAVGAYERAVRADPANTYAMVNAAATLLRSGKTRKAGRWIERARAGGSTDPRIPDLLKIIGNKSP